jgi:hypothetical protein
MTPQPPPPPPPPQPPPPPGDRPKMAMQQSIDFQLKHPFSMMACGPSTCGKKYFVKTVLQNNLTKVTPPVQRTVWLYKPPPPPPPPPPLLE